ncbi:SRC kinase signaling inhibitor 1-like [Nerophis ophidion]|uniref:SRC kinase signaling inhibitor 1-like n=1 Tax=Nerophis ophidion TaxID=159077 RepID=UPI002AE077CE|nr:SRC kinase signaling inhibitor 1-like [Nerophis ophidion]
METADGEPVTSCVKVEVVINKTSSTSRASRDLKWDTGPLRDAAGGGREGRGGGGQAAEEQQQRHGGKQRLNTTKMGNSSFPAGREKRKLPMISANDGEFPRDYHTLAGGIRARRIDGASNGGLASSSLDRRHKTMAAKSLEALTSVHKADVERQRHASMELQKNNATNSPGSLSLGGAAARGRQQQQQQQQGHYWSFKSRAPRVTRLSPTKPVLAEQTSRVPLGSAEHLEAMSESEVPVGFNRMNRLRQSLPLARSSSQNKLRAPGVLLLQLGEETRRVHLSHELSSLDTLRALIVHVFPQRLTMATLRSPSTALLIKDETRNVFYELEDPRDVQDRCVIKIYCKEPIYGTFPGRQNPHLANGDVRREVGYAPQDSPPPRRLSNAPMTSQHSSASSSPPQGSPSRARLLYSGGRPSSYAGPPHHPHSSPHHSQPAFCSTSSAILERRDVKPDDEVGGSRSVVLVRADERVGIGGAYTDPYSLAMDSNRMTLAGAPHSPLAGRTDPYGSLYRRGGGGSVRSLTSYSAAALQGELMEGGALYRPGGPLYNDAYAASVLAMGLRVPPPSSPQKIPDMRDSYASTLPTRGSPGRHRDSVTSSLCRDGPKGRGQGSGMGLTSDQLCLMAVGDGGGARGLAPPLLGNETETRERMEVMEKQIASLTGLLQRVLHRAPDTESPDKMDSASDGSATAPGPAKIKKAVTPSGPLALMPPPLPSGAELPVSVSRVQMQRHLQGLQHSTNTLRMQLSQLRSMQLENRDSVVALLRQTEMELSGMMLETVPPQEDPLQRQRLLVEEERLKYLNQEELLIQKLHNLEKWVEELQRRRGLVSEHDMEQRSQEISNLEETLGQLKNQFPGLQSRMRVVLRVEVEAVKFLKEEPLRLDALLKRCNSVSDTLSALRRQVCEGPRKDPEDTFGQLQNRSEEVNTIDSPPLSLADWVPTPRPPPELDNVLPLTFRGRATDELQSRRPAAKCVSAEVRLAAERDWEEKRASLTQFSAQDINRLLEETQAELMKAIPDLDFATRTINKPAVPPKPQISTGEQIPNKVQLAAQKLNSLEGVGPPRGSVDLGVVRCRSEKTSKSPPPPPPRRSFPSALGLSPGRAGDAILANKSLKMDEDGQLSKTIVKLRRTPSDNPRPASTPPPSSLQHEEHEDKMVAELQSSSTTPGLLKGPTVAARLKHLEQGHLERNADRKSKEEVKVVQEGGQQVFHF